MKWLSPAPPPLLGVRANTRHFDEPRRRRRLHTRARSEIDPRLARRVPTDSQRPPPGPPGLVPAPPGRRRVRWKPIHKLSLGDGDGGGGAGRKVPGETITWQSRPRRPPRNTISGRPETAPRSAGWLARQMKDILPQDISSWTYPNLTQS